MIKVIVWVWIRELQILAKGTPRLCYLHPPDKPPYDKVDFVQIEVPLDWFKVDEKHAGMYWIYPQI
jgi:hypothetical protein